MKFEGKFKINSLDDTQKHAQTVAKSLKKPSVILLSGDLGVGKTQWIRFFVQAYLKNKNVVVTSPSYSLVNEYSTADKKVVHFDLYRLRDSADLESTGFWDFLDEKNIICVEWGGMIPPEQLKERPLIKIEIVFTEQGQSEQRELSCVLHR